MSVIDEHEHRSLLRVRREEAEGCGAHGEALPSDTRSERQGAFEGRGSSRRDSGEHAERRAQHIEEPRERNIGFGLDASCAQKLEARRVLGCIFEQRGLPDTSLTDQRQHRTATKAGGCHDAIERQPLLFPAEQHASIVRWSRLTLSLRLKTQGGPRTRAAADRQ